VDVAVAAAQVTSADVDRAAAQLQSVRSQLDVLAAQRSQAQATLKARQADVMLARITLGWTRITSPVDGALGARRVRVGALVGPGTEIVSVTPLDTVWVTANFTERQIAGIVPGRRARLHVDAFPGTELDGHVVGLSPGTGATFGALPADNTTGNFTKVVQRVPVKIAIDWNGSKLRGQVRPGMSVLARVATEGAPDAPWPTQ
jgi:membrane fusion protein (multidrug efflux system)